MKIACYADIHHGEVIGKLGPSGFDMRMEDTFKIEDKLTDFCIEHEIYNLIFNGDRFKSRNPSVWLMNKVDELWTRRGRKGVKTLANIGNHDVYRVTHYGSSYSPLWESDTNITIYSKPKSFTLLNGGVKIGFLPYGYKLDDIDKVDLLFFHDEIQGFEDDRGYKAPAWIGSTGLNLKEMEKKCKVMIGGHIHSHIGIAGKGVYIGAPYQLDKLDIGKSRGLIVIDLEDLSIEFIEIDAPKLVELRSLSEITSEVVEGNYVTVYVKPGEERDATKALEELGARSFVVHTLKERGMMIENIAKDVYASDNDEDAIREYVSSRELANKELVTETGLKIWKETEL